MAGGSLAIRENSGGKEGASAATRKSEVRSQKLEVLISKTFRIL